jgi:hypothetical protein
MLKASNHDDNPKEKEFGRFCIEVATSQNSTSLMKILINIAGDSKDLQDENGWTPLHFGAAEGHADIVDLLLKHGAGPIIKTKIPGTYNAAELAMYYGNPAIAAYIQGSIRRNKFHDKNSDLQPWTWHIKPRKQDQFVEWPIHDLISIIVDKVKGQRFPTTEIVWCHLPANSVSIETKLIFLIINLNTIPHTGQELTYMGLVEMDRGTSLHHNHVQRPNNCLALVNRFQQCL